MIEADRLKTVFARLGVPVFLVRETVEAGNPVVTIHTTERSNLKALTRRANEALKAEGVTTECRVVSHRAGALRRARSLESLGRRFGEGRIVYDPTAFVARSEVVVDCGRRMREALGDRVEHVYLDAARRTLYLIVEAKKADLSPAEANADREELVRKATDVMREWQKTKPGLALAVRIGTEAPRGAKLVSVDRRSVNTAAYRMVFGRRRYLRGAAAFGMAAVFGASLSMPAAAAEPAVSEQNITFVGSAGRVDDQNSDDEGVGNFAVKAATPLGQSFGFQAEGGIGTDEYYGVGGHLFWRDPKWAMLGVFVSQEARDQVELTRFGLEAEYYLDSLTIGARVGHEEGDFIEDGMFGRLDVSYYVQPNLALRGGGEWEEDDDNDRFRVGIEWQPAMGAAPNLSMFADGEWSDDDTDAVMAGIKIHFGGAGVSLRDRERKEDPGWTIFNRRSHTGYSYVPD